MKIPEEPDLSGWDFGSLERLVTSVLGDGLAVMPPNQEPNHGKPNHAAYDSKGTPINGIRTLICSNHYRDTAQNEKTRKKLLKLIYLSGHFDCLNHSTVRLRRAAASDRI